MQTLNELYSSLSSRRRYEVWFLRLGLSNGSGAWWFRYLLMNPGRCGCLGDSQAAPIQVWATWFPQGGKPKTFIQGFPLDGVDLSDRRASPFHFRIAGNEIGENFCRGTLQVDGHEISWDLRWRSMFRVTLSNKGWIGFSRTPHSDAMFSGQIRLDGCRFEGDPLGFGVQGHNCGYRHRNFWTWTHIYFPRADSRSTTLEALVYEMPFGLVFRKAVLWHDGEAHSLTNLQETKRNRDAMEWDFRCSTKNGLRLNVSVDGTGPGIHHLPYIKTDCSGSFEVANNSLAKATLNIERPDKSTAALETNTGAVLEMVGGKDT